MLPLRHLPSQSAAKTHAIEVGDTGTQDTARVRGIASWLVGSPATPHIGCDCSRCTIRFSVFWVNRAELTCRIRGVTNTTRNSGGDGRIRTYALLRPALQAGAIDQLGHISKNKMARLERFELPTAWFVARYSIQMSYRRKNWNREQKSNPLRHPSIELAPQRGFEPRTSSLTVTRSTN